METATQTGLVLTVQVGDTTAFETLVEPYRPKMRERVTRGKVASQTFRCNSARTALEATPLQSTHRRKPVADTAFCYEWSNGK